MKRILNFLMLLVLGVVLLVGAASCGKESSGGIEPTPVQPTPNNGGGGDKPEPEKPTPENPDAQQLYEDAFKIISESHDYDKAVENLKQAAEANVDSANLTLAYMYEYGIGVDQDIEKAKDFYAKEASAHNNEFAADKLASLSNNQNNCVVQLPEGCNIRANEVLIDCGDTITFTNGDGSFNTSSRIIKVCDFDGEIVNICYRHPEIKGNFEVNSLETAITLMLCNVPYGFNLSESAYNKVREQLLLLDETKQLAEEIDKQVKAKGHFDMMSVAPIVARGRRSIYETYGGNKIRSKSGSQGIMAGTVERDGFMLRDDYDNTCLIGEGSVKNDITTTFKSGYYDSQNKEWNVVVNINNLSQICFMAVPGIMDLEHNEFVPKYNTWYDRLLNGTFVPASKFFDFGGGSFSGFIEANVNFISMLWECSKSDAYSTSIHEISLSNDIETSLELWADAQRAYREKYLAEEEVIEMQLQTSLDALKYSYPLHNGSPFDENVDGPVLAYWFTFYFVMPVWDFVVKYGKLSGQKLSIKNFVLNVVSNLITDKDWVASLQQCISSGKWMDDNADELYRKTYFVVLEEIADTYDKSGVGKAIISSAKTGVEVAEKIGDEKYVKAGMKVVKYSEKSILKLTDNDWLQAVAQTLATSEDLITFGSGLVKMIFCDYNSFVVRFGMSNEDLHLMYTPIENVTSGVSSYFSVKANTLEPFVISLYANDKLLIKDEDALSIVYDLSQLVPGSYKIKIVADFMLDDGSMCNFVTKTGEFRCSVTPPFNGKVSPASGVELNIDTKGNGFAPNVQGQDLEQHYNSGGTTNGAKGYYLDQTYNGGAVTSEVKGHNL